MNFIVPYVEPSGMLSTRPVHEEAMFLRRLMHPSQATFWKTVLDQLTYDEAQRNVQKLERQRCYVKSMKLFRANLRRSL